MIHLLAGGGVLVKGIIVAAALVLGYGSVAYFKGPNEIEKVAEEIIEIETGLPMHFAECDKDASSPECLQAKEKAKEVQKKKSKKKGKIVNDKHKAAS